jgi:hypothetical protein
VEVWVLNILLKKVHEKISEEIGSLSHGSQLVAELGFIDVVVNFTYSTFSGFLTLEFIVFEIRLVGHFLLWADLCIMSIGGNPHFEFCGRT